MELHVGEPITLKKFIQLSTDYKEDLKQYENDNQNERDKSNINEEKYLFRKHPQNYMHTYIWMMLIKANMNQFQKFEQIILTRQQSIPRINNQSKYCIK